MQSGTQSHESSVFTALPSGSRAIRGERTALLVVDMSRGLTEPDSPLACDADAAVDAIGPLLAAARAAGAPVFFTTVAYAPEDHRTAAVFLEKAPVLRMLKAGSRWAEIDPRLQPNDDESVLRQVFPSAFFGTPLVRKLQKRGVDTVMIAGASTSGSVRATVLDALQYGFVPLVPRDAVADRDPSAAAQALADIELKYGYVISQEEALAQIAVPQPAR